MSATFRGAERQPNDFYATPLSALEPLLFFINFLPSPIWEPAQGDGRLVECLRKNGFAADGDDLQNGYDFLKDDKNRAVILTNPPFSLAQEFCDHAIKHADHVFMLLRLNFLGSQKRLVWWKRNNLGALFVLSQRPKFSKNKKGKLGSDATEYAWFYWGPAWKGIFHLCL